MPTSTNFGDRWIAAATRKKSCLVVGIDPVPERLPTDVIAAADQAHTDPAQRDAEAARQFGFAVVDAVKDWVPAVKPQIAFFEALGPNGVVAYADVLRYARQAGLLVIADIKRGDIGSTATAYAAAYLSGLPGRFEADAVTVSPYLGRDSMEPFVSAAQQSGGGAFVLVRTSNKSAGDLQDLGADRPVYQEVARLVDQIGKTLIGESGYSAIGAVVGATYPDDVTRLRQMMPSTLFLLPGFGAQGATAEMLAGAFDKEGHGGLVAASRSIIYAGAGAADWREAISTAAQEANEQINAVRFR